MVSSLTFLNGGTSGQDTMVAQDKDSGVEVAEAGGDLLAHLLFYDAIVVKVAYLATKQGLLAHRQQALFETRHSTAWTSVQVNDTV